MEVGKRIFEEHDDDHLLDLEEWFEAAMCYADDADLDSSPARELLTLVRREMAYRWRCKQVQAQRRRRPVTKKPLADRMRAVAEKRGAQ